jgi:putative PIN family toxin of toxin-antitoxin system
MRGAWARGTVVPLICRVTGIELLEVTAKKKFGLDPEEQTVLLDNYLPFADIVVLPDPLPALAVACRDPDDDVFIHLALVGNAECLVTGDADLLALRDVAPVRVVTLNDFSEMVSLR